MRGSQLGISASVHQNQVIGSFSMIGMHSFITKKLNLTPGYIYFGKPAKKKNKNLIGLKRNNITSKILTVETNRYKKIKSSNK